jgi:GNAT superfamily N-acetyltransferase
VLVRRAGESDVPALLELFDEMSATMGRRSPRPPQTARAQAEQRYRRALTSPEQQMLVALEPDGTVVGMSLLEVSNSTLEDTSTVLMVHTHVRRTARRHGAGRALVAAAAAWAEDRGAEMVSVNVYPQHRESQRFYVRLGFAPLVVRRVVPLQVLKRRLGQDSPAPPVATVGEALHTATRRGLRARIVTARAVSERRRAQ